MFSSGVPSSGLLRSALILLQLADTISGTDRLEASQQVIRGRAIPPTNPRTHDVEA